MIRLHKKRLIILFGISILAIATASAISFEGSYGFGYLSNEVESIEDAISGNTYTSTEEGSCQCLGIETYMFEGSFQIGISFDAVIGSISSRCITDHNGVQDVLYGPFPFSNFYITPLIRINYEKLQLKAGIGSSSHGLSYKLGAGVDLGKVNLSAIILGAGSIEGSCMTAVATIQYEF